MITQQTKRRVPSKPEKLGGKRLTLPGLYVKPYEALQQYTDKSIEEKMANAYSDEGSPIPNFEMMDKIERLEALSEYQAIVMEKRAELNKRNNEAKEAKQKEEFDNLIKQRVNESLQQQQTTAGTGSTK